MRTNDLYKSLCKSFKSINFELIDLKTHQSEFQNFLETVPDFFLLRQGKVASTNEAEKIINSFPENVTNEQKIICGICFKKELIGFFEILIHFPTKSILAQEPENIKKETGDLSANRFTISFLVINKSYRSKGIGSKTMKIIENTFEDHGYQYSHLVVNENNPKAKVFYLNNGYKVIKEATQAINNNLVNSTIMVKQLLK